MKKVLAFLVCVIFLFVSLPGYGSQITVNTGTSPLLGISRIDVDEEIQIGEEFLVEIIVSNMGTGTAMNPRIVFEEHGETGMDHFSIGGGSGGNTYVPDIQSLDPGTEVSFTIPVIPGSNIAERPEGYILDVKAEASDYTGVKQFAAMTSIQIHPKYTVTVPLFVVENIVFRPEVPDASEPFEADIIFRNISSSSAGNASFALEDVGDNKNFRILDLSNTRQLYSVAGEDARMVTYCLEGISGRESNEVKAVFRFSYRGEEKTQEEIINLPLDRTDLEDVGKKPLVIINKYVLSEKKIMAGSNVGLNLFLENTNRSDVKNIKLSLGVVELEDDQVGGTVFSPVESSNTFYLDKIEGKNIIGKEILLYVDANAQAKTYIVPVTIEYEDIGGNSYTVEDIVTIPVTQKEKFQVLSLDVPREGFVGQPINISSEFVNVGKVNLSNMIVNLEGDFEAPNAMYYIGSLETGRTDYYQGTIIPGAEGELSGKIVYSYYDSNNTEIREERDFTIAVGPAPVFEPVEGTEGGPEGVYPAVPEEGKAGFPFGAAVYVLLGAAVLFMSFKNRKLKKKLKEKEEMFDEIS